MSSTPLFDTLTLDGISPLKKGARRRTLCGQKFGYLTPFGILGLRAPRRAMWLVRCDCGTFRIVDAAALVCGVTTSCGCKRVRTLQAMATHGHHRVGQETPEYRSYRAARQRCLNPRNPAFDNYGGRGIEWRFKSFQHFLDEIGFRPAKGYSLDRIDNSRHYEPGNVRWATTQEQTRNTRYNVWVTIDGRSEVVQTWSEISSINSDTIRDRLRHDWCSRCAVFNAFRVICSHRNTNA